MKVIRTWWARHATEFRINLFWPVVVFVIGVVLVEPVCRPTSRTIDDGSPPTSRPQDVVHRATDKNTYRALSAEPTPQIDDAATQPKDSLPETSEKEKIDPAGVSCGLIREKTAGQVLKVLSDKPLFSDVDKVAKDLYVGNCAADWVGIVGKPPSWEEALYGSCWEVTIAEDSTDAMIVAYSKEKNTSQLRVGDQVVVSGKIQSATRLWVILVEAQIRRVNP